jgi:hypothetical protein
LLFEGKSENSCVIFWKNHRSYCVLSQIFARWEIGFPAGFFESLANGSFGRPAET